MKPEQKFWNNCLKPSLNEIKGLCWDRVESDIGQSGLADVIVHYGHTIFIENKSSKTKFYWSLGGWRDNQRIWADERIKCGAVVLLAIGSKELGNIIVNASSVLEMDKISDVDNDLILMHWIGKSDPGKLSMVLRNTRND